MGTYEEYVEDLAALTSASTKEEAQVEQGAKEMNAAQRAEYQTRVKEHQRSQERIDKKMKKLDGEKSEILAYFFENPTDYAPVKAQRLSELDQQIEALELAWVEDQESIDELRIKLNH